MAWAHKINLFITNEQNNVYIYSYFANAAPCKHCQLFIKHNGTLLLKTNLDDEGKYTYTSSHQSLDISVVATGGHQAKQSVVVSKVSHESKSLQEHQDQQKENNRYKIILALILMALLFAVLKRVKR